MSIEFVDVDAAATSGLSELLRVVGGELLLATPETFSELVARVLRRAGEAWRADRLSVFQFRPSEAEIIHEWHADGGSSLGAAYPAADLPAMWPHLLAGETMVLDTNAAAPEGWEAEYAIMREIGVRIEYIAAMPRGPDRKWLISIEWDREPPASTAGLHGEIAAFTHLLERALEANERAQELVRLSEHFKKRQRLEAIGTMAGGIAHDFNNVLQAVRSFADLAAEEDATLEEVREATEAIAAITRRAAGLTRRLLIFSRQGARSYNLVAVPEMLREVVEMLRRTLPEDRLLRLDCSPSLGSVRIPRSDVEQVVINLCNNAAAAMPEGGPIRIEARALRDDTGDWVVIHVSDRGCGVAPGDRERVFEPFFTTKRAGEGTGLGLSMAKRVVEEAGGSIALDSTLGEGTTVSLRLPAVDEAAAASASVDLGELRGSESVLLVEDDPFIRRVTRTQLERQGYRVTACDDGEQALRAFEDEPERFAIVVSDAVMPKLSGRKLFERLRARRPDLPFVFTSGYDAGMLGDVLGREGVELLPKPYTTANLLTNLRALLGSERSG